MIKGRELFSAGGVTHSERSLHTPGNFAKRYLLYVQEVGWLESLKPHRCVREGLESFLFMIVLEGKGCLSVGERSYELQKGNCAFVDCMEHYEHISDEKDAWKLAWVHFNGHAARGYYDLFLKANENSNVLRLEDLDVWAELMNRLLKSQEDKCLSAELYSGEQLFHILNRVMDCTAHINGMEDETGRLRIGEIREFLNEQYASQDVLEKLEREYGKEFSFLKGAFYQYSGIGMEDYIRNRRLNAAKELLRFSIKPIEEIAAETGIGTADDLQQMFMQSEDMPAEEYRMKWAQWVR